MPYGGNIPSQKRPIEPHCIGSLLISQTDYFMFCSPWLTSGRLPSRRHGPLHDLGVRRCRVFRHAGTGHLIPWRVKVGESVQDHLVRPAISTNDETVELGTVLAGKMIGQITGPTAAAHIRAGRLVPLLLDHMTDMYSLFLNYGSRAAQPARVRRFIDLAVERLTDSPEFVLGAEEQRLAHINEKSSLG